MVRPFSRCGRTIPLRPAHPNRQAWPSFGHVTAARLSRGASDAFVYSQDRLEHRRTPLFKELVVFLAESGQLGPGPADGGPPRPCAAASGTISGSCLHEHGGSPPRQTAPDLAEITLLDQGTLAYSLASPLRATALRAFLRGWMAYLDLVDAFDQLERTMRTAVEVRVCGPARTP